MRLSRALLLFVATAPVVAQNRTAFSPETLYAKCKPSVVTILTFDSNRAPLGQGSGFIVAQNRVVTNYHVAAGSASASIIFDDGSLSSVTAVVAGSAPKDLVILETETGNRPHLVLGDELKLKVGQAVYAIGAPNGLSASLSNGLVSGFREDEGQFLIQITAPIAPGSSGGPLLDSQGEVVGVATSRLKDSGFGFAMGVGDVQHLLRAPLSVKIKLSDLEEEAPSPASDLTPVQGLFDQKKYDDARASFDALSNATKGSFEGQVLLCKIEQAKKEHKLAIQACNSAIQLKPTESDPYGLNAYSFLALGEPEQAEAAASKASQLSKNSEYKGLLAAIHYSEEEYDIVQKELPVDSNDKFLLGLLAGAAMHNHDYSSFRQLLDKLTILDGNQCGWKLYLEGLQAQKDLNWDTALAKFRKCDADEDFVDSVCLVSAIHVELTQANYTGAKSDIDTLLSNYPKNHGALSTGIFFNMIVGNTAEADRLHDVFKSIQAQEQDEFTECLYYYGRNRPLLATSHCQAAIKNNESSYQAWSNAGYASLDNADYQSAFAYFSKAAKLFYDSKDKHTVIQELDVSWGSLLAEYYSGDKKDAKTLYRGIKKTYPEFVTVAALKQLPLVWSDETVRLLNRAIADLK